MSSLNPDRIPKSLQCLISGAVLPFAFAPYNFYLLAILSPALLLYNWLQSKPSTAFRYGYLYGLGLFGVGISWLHISINLFGGINLAGSVLLTFLFAAFLSLYPALIGYLLARCCRNLSPAGFLLLAAPALWTLGEWIRGWLFTGFPWLNLGYSQIDSPLAGIAPLLGVYGITFAVLLTAGVFAGLFRFTRRQQYVTVFLVLILWQGSWWLARLQWSEPAGDTVSVALVQGAVPQELKWREEMRQATLDRYEKLSRPWMDFDLLIWPEAAIPAYYHQAGDYLQNLLAITRRNRNHLMTGMPVMDTETGKYYNSIVMLGDGISFYHKRHLVPFGEYLPLAFLLGGIVDYLGIPMSDFSPGENTAPTLAARDVNIGASICYEGIFGEEIAVALPEADILVNVSNDAWFGDSAAPHQHLQMARMRALETGRYMLRGTNTGVTAIIDEKGRILKSLPQFVPETLTGEAVLFRGSTPYIRFGNYPIIIFCLLLLCWPVFRYKRFF